MQLKSLTLLIKKDFYKFFYVPSILLALLFTILLFLLNFKSKNFDDLQSLRVVEKTLVNSLLSFQTYETTILINSLMEFREWDETFLINKDNIILFAFPSKNIEHVGKEFNQFCSNEYSLFSQKMKVAKICYSRSWFSYFDRSHLLLIGSFFGLMFVFISLNRIILKRFEYFFQRISNAINLLHVDVESDYSAMFLEEDLIFKSVKTKLELQKRNTANSVRVEVAEQVSHDIRSPLAVINSITENFIDQSKPEYSILKKSFTRVEKILSDLMIGKNFLSNKILDGHAFSNVNEIVETIFVEKNLLINIMNPLIKISLNLDFDSIVYIRANDVDLLRVLSNLVNNSIESFKYDGKISLSSHLESSKVVIVVSDNGPGIPFHIFEKIGERGLTFGKENSKSGSGLGLPYAKKIIEGIKGRFEVNSSENGTSIKISIPYELILAKGDSIEYLYIEDDELSRETWKIKALKRGINFLSIESPFQFESIESLLTKNTKIYIDNDFGDANITGEKFAMELSSRGYTNLSICSGHGPEKFSHLSWLKYSPKKCPF